MAKDNMISYIILGLLNHEDMTGYEIKKRIDSSISYFWNAGYGQIYPTLKSLESNNLVTNRIEENGNRPNKIVYSITIEGKKELHRWLSASEEKENIKYEILLKLFFGGLVSTENNIKKIQDFKLKGLANLEMMDKYKDSLEHVISQGEDHLYYYLTVLFGHHMFKAYVDWAEEAIEILENHDIKFK